MSLLTCVCLCVCVSVDVACVLLRLPRGCQYYSSRSYLERISLLSISLSLPLYPLRHQACPLWRYLTSLCHRVHHTDKISTADIKQRCQSDEIINVFLRSVNVIVVPNLSP